jgi:hypothetical protein
MHAARSHDALIRAYDELGNMIEMVSSHPARARAAVATIRRARRNRWVRAERRTCVGSRTTGMRDREALSR